MLFKLGAGFYFLFIFLSSVGIWSAPPIVMGILALLAAIGILAGA